MTRQTVSQTLQQTPVVTPVGSGMLQRKCSCGNHTMTGGECAECNKWLRENTVTSIPSTINNVLNSPGQPLDHASRAFFESRFRQDFGHVRLHTDHKAAKSAQAVNALAYTVGRNIIFNNGQFAPMTLTGQRLIAHELTHVLQQQQSNYGAFQGKLEIGSADNVQEHEADLIADSVMNRNTQVAYRLTPIVPKIQRACGADAIDEPTGCEFLPGNAEGLRYLFVVNCDDFARGNEMDLRVKAAEIQDGEIVEVHGLASADGNPTFNLNLSCARALRAKAVIEEVLTERGISATVRVFNHGQVEGNVVQQRSVVLKRTAPSPDIPPQQSIPKCGPDATDWFIRQVNAAKDDPIVLALKGRLLGAERLARRFGFSAERIAEGAVAKKLLDEEARVGSPPRTTEAKSQITASVPGQQAFSRAVLASSVPVVGAPEAFVLAAIRGSALTWKNLVGTGKKYDFKNSPRTLQSPISANCPVDCAQTITMCPVTPSDCFVKDVPGNLFYAHVGRFVGWTELALQLGSQFAQLESSAHWDPPEDTRMISFGFGLPDPLTRSDLCSAINANRSIFDLQNCSNCPEEVTADVV